MLVTNTVLIKKHIEKHLSFAPDTSPPPFLLPLLHSAPSAMCVMTQGTACCSFPLAFLIPDFTTPVHGPAQTVS